MSKPNKEKAKQNVVAVTKKDIIESMDVFLDKRLNMIFLSTLLLTLIFGFFLFDVKVSVGGDDSSYILRAKEFIDGKAFPSFQGAFYPVFLSLFVLVFGVHVIVLKAISLLLIIGHFVFFYLLLRKRVNSTFVVLGLILISINSYILYFSSQTYSEALYMFLQALLLYLFIRMYEKLEVMEGSLANDPGRSGSTFFSRMIQDIRVHMKLWPSWLAFGFVLFLITNTRNIGLAALLSILFVFLINKKFCAFVFTCASYMVFTIPFKIYKTVVWDVTKSSVSDQLNLILLKNVYNPTGGTEDLPGMWTRFVMNSKIYFSKWLSEILGLRAPFITEYSLPVTLSYYILFFIALYFAFRKSKFMTSIGVYLGAAVAVSFISLGANWGQMRMIVIYVPLIIVFLSWGLYRISKIEVSELSHKWVVMILSFFVISILFYMMRGAFHKDFKLGFFSLALFYISCIAIGSYGIYSLFQSLGKWKISYIYTFYKNTLQIVIIFFILFSTFNCIDISLDKIKHNKKVLEKNLKGNLYYGFTPDWVNFLKMSEWAAKNLPKDAVVASRKHSMSFIYGKGKEFYPVYNFPMENSDTIIKKLKTKNIEYCIINEQEFAKKKIPMNIMMGIKRNTIDAFIAENNIMYGVYNFNNPMKGQYYSVLDNYKVEYSNSLDMLKGKTDADKVQTYAVIPDSLIKQLYNDKVEYMIRASLRMNPNQKTDRTINTILRYMYYIELKYPGVFSLVHTIGAPDEEPAYLFKINYRNVPEEDLK